MTNSLKDQLMGLGFKPAPKPERKPDEHGRKPHHGKGGAPGRPGARGPGGPGGGKPRHGKPGHDKPGGAKPAGAKPDGSTPDGEGQGAGAARPDGRGPRRRGGKRRGGGSGGGAPGTNPTGSGRPGGGTRSQEEIDLAKAYAIRAQKEKQERIDAEQAKQEAARVRREARAKFDAIIEGKAVNAPEAEHPRHFDYGGKIKRVYCTEAQIKQLNAGELWVGQQKGRYLLLPIALLAEAKAAFPDGIALEVDPNATREQDPYADPQYQVPDDLIW